MIGRFTTEELERHIRDTFTSKAKEARLDPDDLTQDIIIRLIELKDSAPFDPERGDEQTYVYFVGRSVLVDSIRKQRRDNREHYRIHLEEGAQQYEPSIFPTLETILEDLQLSKGSTEAEAIELMLRGYSRKEVAEELNVSYHTKWLRGLLKTLEEYLREDG